MGFQIITGNGNYKITIKDQGGVFFFNFFDIENHFVFRFLKMRKNCLTPPKKKKKNKENTDSQSQSVLGYRK